MKKSILISVMFFAAIIFANAGEPLKNEKNDEQQIVLKGKVVDKKTGEALVGATIKVGNSDYKVYTDLDGNFEMKGLKAGNYNIIVSYISYNSSLIEQKIIQSNNSSLDVELVEEQK